MTETKTDGSGAQPNSDSAAAADASKGAAPARPAEAQPTKTDTGGAAAAAAPAPEKPAVTIEKPGEAPKPPEKYSFAVPEADQKYVDPRMMTYFEQVAKASGYSQDDAQAALDDHLANVKAEHATFLAETKADPDYGGDNLAETQRLANLVIDRIRPVGHAHRDPFRALINRQGAFNHIEVVSFLADLGKLMAEDGAGQSTTGGARKPVSVEEKLYGAKSA